MKKKISVLLCFVIIAMISVLFVGCTSDKKNTYTVTFVGEGVETSVQQVIEGEYADKIADPVREGFTFLGWYLNGVEFKFDVDKVNSNITLLAKWSDNSISQVFNVTFTGEGVTQQVQKVISGELAVEINDPVRENYEFLGWYLNDEKFDFENTVIVSNITLTAKWESVSSVISGEGTKESPYLISNYYQLEKMANFVNSETGNYASATYSLTNDIDCKAKVLTPIGLYDGSTDVSFSGTFNGNNYSISNYKIENKFLNKSDVFYVGLFGQTENAVIENLTIKNYTIKLNATKTVDKTSIIGSLIGLSMGTNIYNCNAEGKISVFSNEKNQINIGGLVGYYKVLSGGQSFIDGCNVRVIIDSDEVNGFSGGLAGILSSTGEGALSVVNCSVIGDVKSGTYTGGITGNLDTYGSIINCYYKGDIEALNSDYGYAGGLVGFLGSGLIMDSYAEANVTTVETEHGYFTSFAGLVVGYYTKDSYLYEYNQGGRVINTYALSGKQVVTVNETPAETVSQNNVNNDFFNNTLKWDNDYINFENMMFSKTNSDKEWSITLDNNKSDTKYKNGELIKYLEKQPKKNNEIFFDWMFNDTDLSYTFYMPFYKDMTFDSKYVDCTSLFGTYIGEEEKNGSIIINDDGTIQWISSVTNNGNYRFDGTNFLFDVTNFGDIAAVVNSDGQIEFVIPFGQTDYPYVFTKYNPLVCGSYISEYGDLFTFSGEKTVVYEHQGKSYKSEFSVSDGKIIVKNASSAEIACVLTVDNKTVTVESATGKDAPTQDTSFVYGEKPDYTNEKFLGKYYFSWIENTSNGPYLREYELVFQEDGVFKYLWRNGSYVSETVGSFVYIKSSNYIRTILNSYVSTFTYSEENDWLFGTICRGSSSAVSQTSFFTRDNNYEYYALTTDGASSYKDYRSEYVMKYKNVGYYFKDNVLITDAVVTFNNDVSLTVEYNDKTSNYHIDGIRAIYIDKEVGTYSGSKGDIIIDGMGNASGAITGRYRIKDDKQIIIWNDDGIFSFDYVKALANNNQYEEIVGDGFGGVWYYGKMQQDENGNDVFNPYAYKLLVDGFGFTCMFYYNQDNKQYAYNWPVSNAYFYYQIKNEMMITAYFNESNEANLLYYYDNNLINLIALKGYLNSGKYTKKDYTGSTEITELPKSFVKTWVYQDDDTKIFIIINDDASGSLSNVPFYGAFDGENILFSVNDVDYSAIVINDVLKVKSNDCTKDYTVYVSDIDGSFTLFVGVWKGTLKGIQTINDVTITIKEDGTCIYQNLVPIMGTYDKDTKTFTVVTDTQTITMTYKWDKQEMNVRLTHIDSESVLEGTFKK